MTCMKCGKGTEFVIVYNNQYGLLNENYCLQHFVEYCKAKADFQIPKIPSKEASLA